MSKVSETLNNLSTSFQSVRDSIGRLLRHEDEQIKIFQAEHIAHIEADLQRVKSLGQALHQSVARLARTQEGNGINGHKP
jgi:Na+/phosphate symporter